MASGRYHHEAMGGGLGIGRLHACRDQDGASLFFDLFRRPNGFSWEPEEGASSAKNQVCVFLRVVDCIVDAPTCATFAYPLPQW